MKGAAAFMITMLVAATGTRAIASDEDFAVGSLVIPMDTTYQDRGIFEAFGLVYALLRADVPVSWVIKRGKSQGDADFVVSAKDFATNAAIDDHGYRGGPFVIRASDAERARPVVTLWRSTHPNTTVHVTTAVFRGWVSKRLVTAPTIAVFSDGNEDIAFGYLNAAGIPDSTGKPWPTRKNGDSLYPGYPDALTVAMVAGPTTVSHSDGKLFDGEDNPAYCQIMTMHWSVNDVVDEFVGEIRAFLNHPTHLFAECQAVNALENNVHGKFLTTNGFRIGTKPGSVTTLNADYPFAQMDGAFGIVGGSEPSYSLPPGDTYKDIDVVMITAAGSPTGVQDVWMTGFLDGLCSIDDEFSRSNGTDPDAGVCDRGIGKVSYLGGHRYETKLPLSANPNSQGTRLFLNSLFEADCATAEGQPYVTLSLGGPAFGGPSVTYQIVARNFGPGPIQDVVVVDTLPAGVVPVSGTEPYVWNAGARTVTWTIGNLGAGATEALTLTVMLPAEGTWQNNARVTYKVGLNTRAVDAVPVSTTYGSDRDQDGCPNDVEAAQGTNPDVPDTDGDGALDCADTCPTIANPVQDLMTDDQNCGVCGRACALAHAVAECAGGECVIGVCEDGWTDLDQRSDNGCELACVPSAANDVTCDAKDDDCDGQVDEDWTSERCGIGACASWSACVGGVVLACAPLAPGVESLAAGTCENGRDDDCDRWIDGDDPSCAATVDPDTSADVGGDVGGEGDAVGGEVDAGGEVAGDVGVDAEEDTGVPIDETVSTDTSESDTGVEVVENDTHVDDTKESDTRGDDTIESDTSEVVESDTRGDDASESDTAESDTAESDTQVAGDGGDAGDTKVGGNLEGSGCGCAGGGFDPGGLALGLMALALSRRGGRAGRSARR